MAFTSHGHHIRGTVLDGAFKGDRARCGGPGLCRVCDDDARGILSKAPITNDVVDISEPGMFASADWRVINREGENYYLACGTRVYEKPEGGSTSCVKPLGHRTWSHEDFEGRIKDLGEAQSMTEQTRVAADDALKHAGLAPEQRFNTLNALMYAGIQLSKEP